MIRFLPKKKRKEVVFFKDNVDGILQTYAIVNNLKENQLATTICIDLESRHFLFRKKKTEKKSVDVNGAILN